MRTETNIESVPVEALWHLFSFFSVPEVMSVRRISRRFNEAAKSYLNIAAKKQLSLSDEEINTYFTIRDIAINLTILRYIQSSVDNGAIISITQLLLSSHLTQKLVKKHGKFLPSFEVSRSLVVLLGDNPRTLKPSKTSDKKELFFPKYETEYTQLDPGQLEQAVMVSPEFLEMGPIYFYIRFLETTNLFGDRPLKLDNILILEAKNDKGENTYRVVVPANNLIQLSPKIYLTALLYLQLKPKRRTEEWFFYMNALIKEGAFPERFKERTNFSIDKNPQRIICSYNNKPHFIRGRNDTLRRDSTIDLAPFGALAVLKLLEAELKSTLNYESIDEEGKKFSFSIRGLESSLMYSLTQHLIKRDLMSSPATRKMLGVESEKDGNNNNSKPGCVIQ